jgi:hypothetical protein
MGEEMSGQTEITPVIKKEEQKFSVARPPTFTKIYATNIFVISTDSDFRVELFNEKFKTQDGWIYQSEGSIILTKEAAKKLQIMLDEKIKDYEKTNGEIKVSDERMQFNYLI